MDRILAALLAAAGMFAVSAGQGANRFKQATGHESPDMSAVKCPSSADGSRARTAYPFRWFRLNCDFRKVEDLSFAESIVRRAAATGVYNGVLLEPPASRAIETCGSWSEKEVAAFRKFQRLCESSGIEIVPVIW